MDNRFTVQDGVVFCESTLEGKVLLGIKEVGATQNTTLLEVKKRMAAKAKNLGGNAIINFTYAQKADRIKNIFKFDSERLTCTGTVIFMENPPSQKQLSESD
jgi:uncharacterized protein YbjQ (UPF0145 family)